MPWMSIAAAVAGPVIGSIIGGNQQASAANSAADAQTQAAQASIAEQRRQFDINQQNAQPFVQAGQNSVKKLSNLLGTDGAPSNVDDMAKAILAQYPTWSATGVSGNPGSSQEIVDSFLKAAPNILQTGVGVGGGQFGVNNPDVKNLLDQTNNISLGNGSLTGAGGLTRRFNASDLAADPVYNSGLKFGLDQGIGQIQAGAMSNGRSFDSGATAKAIAQYANDYGSTKANDSYNRFTNDQNNIYSKLSGQSSQGQVATSNLGQMGTQMATNVGNSLEGAGNARAAGIVGGANAWGNLGSNISGGVNNYNQQTMLKQLLQGQTSGYNGGSYSPYNVGSYGDYSYPMQA